MIPRNLFGMALSVLPKQEAVIHRWQGRSVNEIGLDVDSYADPEPLAGSIQAVDRARYERLGLDAARDYVMVFTDAPVDDTGKQRNPDRIAWNGALYEVVNRADWCALAGFNGVLAVRIGAADGQK